MMRRQMWVFTLSARVRGLTSFVTRSAGFRCASPQALCFRLLRRNPLQPGIFNGVDFVSGQVASPGCASHIRQAAASTSSNLSCGQFQDAADLFACHGRKLFEKLVQCFAVFESIEKVLDRHTCAAEDLARRSSSLG